MPDAVHDIDFQNPPELSHADVRLHLEKTIPADHESGLVPIYRFTICDERGERVGHLSFKVGETRHILQHVGHIGFEVLPPFRGNHYARKACEAVRTFVARYYDRVILTADADNIASIRTIESLGACYIDEVAVSTDTVRSINRVDVPKRRYSWIIDRKSIAPSTAPAAPAG